MEIKITKNLGKISTKKLLKSWLNANAVIVQAEEVHSFPGVAARVVSELSNTTRLQEVKVYSPEKVPGKPMEYHFSTNSPGSNLQGLSIVEHPSYSKVTLEYESYSPEAIEPSCHLPEEVVNLLFS